MVDTLATAREHVQKAYIAYFGRPADSAGLEYWANDIVNGSSLSGIINAFGNSAESQSLYSASTSRQQVAQIYQQLFGRAPESAGLEYWAGLLDNGAISLQAIALQVLEGAQGSDLDLIDSKLAVAQDFTNKLAAQGGAHTYAGNEDAQAARNYLSEVTVTTTVADVEVKADALISSIYDNEWFEYGGSYSDRYSHFVDENDQIYLLDNLNTRDGPGTGYNTDIFIAKIEADMSSTQQILLGNSDDQYLSAGAVREDGGIVVVGNYKSGGTYSSDSAYIASLDSELNNLQSVKLGTGAGNVSLNDVATDSQGRIIAVGYQTAVADAQDAYIVTLNADMTVHAERRLDNHNVSNSDETLHRVMVLNDDSVLAWTTNGGFVKFDQDLRVEKALSFNFNPNAITELENGNLLATSKGAADFTLLDAELNVLNAWSDGSSWKDFDDVAVNNDGDLIGIWDDTLGDSRYPILTFDVEDFNSSSEIVFATDAKYIVSRSGSEQSMDEILVNGRNFVVRNDDDLFTLKPNHETTPSLSSDYRFFENDTEFMLQSLSKTSYYYPFSSQLATKAFDVSLVGVDVLSSLQVNGGMNITHMDTL